MEDINQYPPWSMIGYEAFLSGALMAQTQLKLMGMPDTYSKLTLANLGSTSGKMKDYNPDATSIKDLFGGEHV